MSDPNQPYVPQEYPKALYRDHGTMRIVANAEEQAEAEAEGYGPFSALPERPKDDLELMTHDQLVDVLIGQLRKLAQGRTRDELLQLARVQRDMEVLNAAAAEREERERAAVQEAVVAMGGERGEEPDNVLYGHSTLADTVEIDGQVVDMGEIVGETFAGSGLTEEAWNDLATGTRDDAIVGLLKAKGWVEPAAEVVIDLEGADSALALAVDAPPEVMAEVTADESQAAPETTAEAATADPLDHDHDGQKGGAPEVDEEVKALRAELTDLKVKFDGRWRAPRLREALATAKAA